MPEFEQKHSLTFQSRRRLLLAGMVTVIEMSKPRYLFAAGSGNELFSLSNSGAYPQGTLSEESLSKHIGTSFWMEVPKSSRITLTLRKLVSRKPQLLTAKQMLEMTSRLNAVVSQTAQLNSFVAIFDSSAPAQPQDSYILDSPFLGRFVVFLTPGPIDSYSATFTNVTALTS